MRALGTDGWPNHTIPLGNSWENGWCSCFKIKSAPCYTCCSLIHKTGWVKNTNNINVNEHTFVTEVTVISGRAFAASLVFGHDTRGAVGAALHTAESYTEHTGCWHFVTTAHTLTCLGGHVYPGHGGTSRPGGARGERWSAVNNKPESLSGSRLLTRPHEPRTHSDINSYLAVRAIKSTKVNLYLPPGQRVSLFLRFSVKKKKVLNFLSKFDILGTRRCPVLSWFSTPVVRQLGTPVGAGSRCSLKFHRFLSRWN